MSQRPRRATLKDVSSEAGVSVFTASRALSGHAGVAGNTQVRVRQVAARLGYVANQHARNLKGSRSNVIGVVAASKTNQYYATLVGALEEAVGVEGYNCFVADAAMNGIYLPEREDRIIESMIQQRVAAVVLTYAIDPSNLALLDSWNIPLLFVDCLPPEECTTYPSVSTDNFAASFSMGEHLALLEYRRWCFVGHARNWNTREPRQQGFERAAADCGARLTVLEGGNDAETARRALVSLLTSARGDDRPDVVFASNTVLLKGVMLALTDCGVEIPRGMAVVAFDDFDWAPFTASPVTVVDQHVETIGRTAGSQMLTIVSGRLPGTQCATRITVPSTLRVRESCGFKLERDQRAGARAPRQ